MILSDFQIIRPSYEIGQEDALNWLLDAHTEAESRISNADKESFRKHLSEKLWKVGCKPDRISKRGHMTPDYLHKNWDQMELYRLTHSPEGENLSIRSRHFGKYVDEIFLQYYPEEQACPPDDLIHVSCTGYVSPSGAQKIASLRNWGHQTTITHAYHMGCYASIPAIRMALGFLSYGSNKNRTDIVHTEVCSLHTNPSNHNTDQLVSQSLFADGFIKYSVKRFDENTHLKVLAVHEEIIPASIDAMTWSVAHWGFEMTLAKEVPVHISRFLPQFLKTLAGKSGIALEKLLSEAIFAVHPGGPKILVYIEELLRLKKSQMAYSFEILKNYGNMSSATLPHIWDAVLRDPQVASNTPIVSLAFGPGLSITGSIMEKICGS